MQIKISFSGTKTATLPQLLVQMFTTTWPGEIFLCGSEVLTELLKETGLGPIALSGIGLIGTINHLGSMSFGQNSLMTTR